MAETRDTVVNPLATLMKAKYGIDRQGSLTLSANDTMPSKIRKIANYIYKNGDWTQEDFEAAVKTYGEIALQLYEPGIMVTGGSFNPKLEGRGSFSGEVYDLQARKENNKKEYLVNVILDPNNKMWSKHGSMYSLRSHEETDLGYIIGNKSTVLGYGKLFDDILKSWEEQKDNFPGVSTQALIRKLSMLGNHSYSQKQKRHIFDVSPEILKISKKDWQRYTIADSRWTTSATDDAPDSIKEYLSKSMIAKGGFSDLLDNALVNSFINNYIIDTYNVVQQQNHEQNMSKMAHARSFERKKNINKSTLEVMNNSILKNYFREIELDNEVDLKAFAIFEGEISRFIKALPKKVDADQPILRLRKIQNHGSKDMETKGLYFNHLKNIVLDFRNGRYSSFGHEYGHYLDELLGKPIKFDQNEVPMEYSLNDAFRPILDKYVQNLHKLGVGRKYYSIPSEVFARGFELWLSDHLHVRSNGLAPATDYNLETGKPEYRAFDAELRKDIYQQFDNIPELALAKERLKNQDFSLVPEKQLLQPTNIEEPELRENADKLSKLATSILNKWLSDVDRFEALISGTGYQLDQPNPNRVIAFDQLQTKALPQIISEPKLWSVGIDPRNFRKGSLPIFEKDRENSRWIATNGYSVDSLRQELQLNGRSEDLDRLEKAINKPERVTNLKKVLEPYLEKGIATEAPSEYRKLVEKMEKRYLIDALANRDAVTQTQMATFKFSAEEREQIKSMDTKTLQELYSYSMKDAKRIYQQVQKKLVKQNTKDKQQTITQGRIKHGR